jgi:uncharacterized RDD family membrane protein YckC
MDTSNVEYVGFFARFFAGIVDFFLQMLFIIPIMLMIQGNVYLSEYWSENKPFTSANFLIEFILPAVATMWLWAMVQATPGKMLIKAKIVDAKTGRAPSFGQIVGRYFAYLLSMLPLGLGFIWIAFNPKKQGWHDILSGTIVVAPKNLSVNSNENHVSFEK